MEKIYSSKEAAIIAEVSEMTARLWAKNNKVRFVGSGRGKVYVWNMKNIEDFKNRDKARKNESKKRNILQYIEGTPNASDLEISKKFDCDRTYVYRLRKRYIECQEKRGNSPEGTQKMRFYE